LSPYASGWVFEWAPFQRCRATSTWSECLPHWTETESKGRARCDGMISAAGSAGDGRTPRGGDTPVLTLRYTAPEAGASAERHILRTKSGAP